MKTKFVISIAKLDIIYLFLINRTLHSHSYIEIMWMMLRVLKLFQIIVLLVNFASYKKEINLWFRIQDQIWIIHNMNNI